MAIKIILSLLASLTFISSINATPSNTVHQETIINTYSQETLLKNWALSVCLGIIAHDKQDKADAGAAASAYLEMGQQDLQAYEDLRALSQKFVARKYSGSIESEFNTMKCIDLFHSQELDQLTKKWVTQ